MNLFVTGGCGFKGTVLVPKLIARGYKVQVLDTQWFGNFLPTHPNLTVTKGDVRDIDNIHLEGIDTVIHLSSVANDPCGDLDPKLTWEISVLATMQLADKAVRQGVKQFIYASSGSVYGVKEEAQVSAHPFEMRDFLHDDFLLLEHQANLTPWVLATWKKNQRGLTPLILRLTRPTKSTKSTKAKEC